MSKQGFIPLKIVNFDIFHEWYLRNKKEIDLGRFDKLIDSQLKLYMDGRLGIIIDKTSQKYEDILKLKIMLESIGYDTSMIFVNTDLNVAKQRVIQRYEKTGRSADVNYIENTFKNIQNNLGKYQSLFNNNFFIIDNTSDSNFLSLEKMVNKFINSPVNNHIAKKFLNS